MLDVTKEMIEKLDEILPTYQDTPNQKLDVPVITYFLYSDPQQETGDTQIYSTISWVVKVWDTNIENMMANTLLVDEVMRSLGYRRVNINQMGDGTLFSNVLTYSGKAKEFLNEI